MRALPLPSPQKFCATKLKPLGGSLSEPSLYIWLLLGCFESVFLSVLQRSWDVYTYIQSVLPDAPSGTLEWLPSVPRAHDAGLSIQFVDSNKRAKGMARVKMNDGCLQTTRPVNLNFCSPATNSQ